MFQAKIVKDDIATILEAQTQKELNKLINSVSEVKEKIIEKIESQEKDNEEKNNLKKENN